MPEINIYEVQAEQSISKHRRIYNEMQRKVLFQAVPSHEACEMWDKALDEM